MDVNQHNNVGPNTAGGEISLDDLVKKSKRFTKYLRSKLLLIAMMGLLGLCVGLAYSIFKKPQYRAVYTFVLEEEDKGGLGQYAGLASLAGVNIEGGGGGIFHGDNILELYKSRNMIEKTLLSTAMFNGKPQKIIDRYINFNKLRKKWEDKPELKNINFNGNPDSFNRQQDSIIIDLVDNINKTVLNVDKPDKKLSIIEVDVFSKDELFAKEFANNIVNTVNSFYILTKTKKQQQNVTILQKQTDSVKSVLNSSITGVASAADASPNANPALSVLRVPSQRRQVDVQISSAVYAEMIKNLELSKIQLRKETPLIQPIDTPVLPLFVNKLGKIKAAILGLVAGLFLCICWLTVKRVISKF
ncbi:lipopolysaccharide biosynthesis protein [Mucilaginibacter sp. BJC16-A38]|uniref:lipopolysaccharide biosynthesis protein n=1 Tax=Mucilaginibacter phenanthrenivorans TaxID=1234842 RepID=UPI0021586916|nr:lipopolysaccharide biosynthesis protein [Mucilaginibacter phenanthrenivorans]MCR8560152.1 lipopolysaccharide biosynthesis protein [Mucilaginibacter phenanthrenivorans]